MHPRAHRLKRTEIVRALRRLGELCVQQKSRVEIAIYGGTVMMLAYNCRTATKDVDAIVAEFYGRRAWEPTKRWLLEQLLKEVHNA